MSDTCNASPKTCSIGPQASSIRRIAPQACNSGPQACTLELKLKGRVQLKKKIFSLDIKYKF